VSVAEYEPSLSVTTSPSGWPDPAASSRVRAGGPIVYSVCTLNADENEHVVDASGLEIDATLGDQWPQFRHPTRPEFLLTLPHIHRTSGFFIARLKL